MKNTFRRTYVATKRFVTTHKIISIFLLLIIIFIGYRIIRSYSSGATVTRYNVAAVTKGTIVSTVTGTGQVAASNQIDLTSKVSGDIASINATNGQQVTAGTVIASIDSRDARVALENAQISLAKLTKAADAPTLLQSENSVADATAANTKAHDDFKKAYDNAFLDVGAAFLDLPDTMTSLSNLFSGPQSSGILSTTNTYTYGANIASLRNKAENSYYVAKQKYDAVLLEYKGISHNSSVTDIENITKDTYTAVKLITEALKDSKTAVDAIRDFVGTSDANITTNESTISTLTTRVANELQTLSSDLSAIDTAKNSITSSARDLEQKTASLSKLKSGADPLDIRSSELDVEQKQIAYDNSFIRAPFDGIVAKINVKGTDTVSSGTSIATFISKQQVANISLNEVDVSKIALGDRVTLTFDAIEDLTITGKVTDIDFIGTVSQGVVTYNVQILLDTQDPRVKAGMSVSAAIATDVHQDVLSVPNSAIKNQGNSYYVDVADVNTPLNSDSTGTLLSTPPVQTPVEIGIADDLSTEIVSGLKESDKVITRTIKSSAAPAAPTSPSLFGGGPRTGATRIGR